MSILNVDFSNSQVPLIKEIQLTLPEWTLILHQTLLFQLILGRWLLPKGELSRDQLSQLLLVQIGMAADILEFITEGLKAEMIYVGNDLHLILMLTVWTWSLPQFTLSLTLTKSRKPRVAGTSDLLEVDSEEKLRMRDRRRGNQSSCCHIFCGTEIWAILVTMTMQDLPFLSTRLYLIFTPQIPISIPFFFFTFKNALLAMLQLYRLSVILQQYRNQRMARAKVTPEHNPAPMMELEDGMANHPGNSRHVPESQPEASAAPTARFTSRFFHGFGPKLRQRKHVSIQTEQSLQIVASISSRWAVDVDDDYYQYTTGDGKHRNSGIINSHEAFSSDSHGALYGRYGSRPTSFSDSPCEPGCQVNIAAEKDDKKDVFAVFCSRNNVGDCSSNKQCERSAGMTFDGSGAPTKYVSGSFDTKADRAEGNDGPGPDGRVCGVDAVDSAEGENTIEAIYEIMSNLGGCRDAGSRPISHGEKNPNGPRVNASGESGIGGDGDVSG